MELLSPIDAASIDPFRKHLGFLVFPTKRVKDVEENLAQLNRIEQDVQNKKSTAEANCHEVSHLVSPWLKDVQKMNDKTQDIPRGGMGCFNVARRYKVGKNVSAILNQINDLKEQGLKIPWTNEKRHLATLTSTSAIVPENSLTNEQKSPSTSALCGMGGVSNFKSRDSLFNNVLQSLKSNKESQKMIALCGIGGVGKTRMMEQLKKAVADSKIFDGVVTVVLGENISVIAFQQAVADYITSEGLPETTEYARAASLRSRFLGMSQKGTKKILVIMDDLWMKVNLEDVGLSPLPNGFKLLFTSRFEYVCTQMRVQTCSIFNVHVLDDAEAETLFFQIVGQCDDPDLQNMGKDIVKICGGLPKAIIKIAESLSGGIKEAWEETLHNLQRHDLQDLGDIVNDFKRSYNHLKKDNKAVFLLSGLFPHDFDIPTEDLMMYAWGLKLFTNVHTLAEARRRTAICIDELIRANMLTESDRNGCVKMHNLLRSFVLSHFSDVKQASIVNYDDKFVQEDANESCERILLKCTGMSEFPAYFNYPNLLLLILMDVNRLIEFPKDFYKRMNKLQVVSYKKSGIPLLPVTFEHSTKLRTLCLCRCPLMDDISVLEILCNLEALSFAHCRIKRLPSAIGKLRKLKLLDVTGCVHLHIDDGVFRDLCKLEELYMRPLQGMPITFTDVNLFELEKLSLSALELEFSENTPLPKYVSFEKLKRFRISIGCGLECNDEYSFKNTVKVFAHYKKLREFKISELCERVEELRLQVNGINNLKDVSVDRPFSNLRDLHVSECGGLAYLFTFDVAMGLSNLERLTVSKCHVLRALVAEDSGTGVIRFKKSNFMSLNGLPDMVNLCENTIELPELVELILDGLPNFRSIYYDNNDTATMQSLFNKEVETPKLEILNISMMEKLEQIGFCKKNNHVSMLRQIIVKKCDSLMTLFPDNPLPLLNNLEELEVCECGSIEVLFNIDFERICRTGEHSSSRLRRIRVEDLRNLKELWMIRGVNNDDDVNAYEALEIIEISDCHNFKNVFVPTTTNFNLKALTTYITRNIGQENDSYLHDVTYPSYLLRTFNHLQLLELENDDCVEEVVFQIDNPGDRELATIRDSQPPLLLPDLKVLKLINLKEIRHVWKCNWNKFLISQHESLKSLFHNLTCISLRSCHKIEYLFSPLVAEFLSNLKNVNIIECDVIEEVISSRHDKGKGNVASTPSHINPTSFPCFDTLKLEYLPCLRRIGGRYTIHDQFQSTQVNSASWSLCQFPKLISIEKCDALSCLIPWYALRQMKRLEELIIKNCAKMLEVFESESNNNVTNNVHEGNTNGGVCTTLTRPTLNNNITIVPQLSNLKCVSIYECDVLTHIFTFSTVQSLKQLKELKLERCKALEVIVKQENETSSEVVKFPCLEILVLDDLPNLEGFFLGMNRFEWPSLDDVMINNCPQLKVFTSRQSETPKLQHIRTSLGRHSLECGLNFHGMNNQITLPSSCSFHNLIEINIERADVEKVIPSDALQQLQSLEQVHLTKCRKVKEIFEVALEGTNNSGLSESVEIPNLTQMYLKQLDDLKYLWKSNQCMVLKFPCLSSVFIQCCPSLEHVFTCSMVGSLRQLQILRISDCKNLEVIVKEEECDAKVNDIMLPFLKSIKLENLPGLKGFCLGKEEFSWPSLDNLHINECHSITKFTKGDLFTPELKVIYTTFGMCYVQEDLNSFMKTKQEEGYKF